MNPLNPSDSSTRSITPTTGLMERLAANSTHCQRQPYPWKRCCFHGDAGDSTELAPVNLTAWVMRVRVEIDKDAVAMNS